MSIQFCVYLQLSKKCPEESISYVSMTDQQYEKMDQIYHLRQMIRSISIQRKLHKHTFIYSITNQTCQTFSILLCQKIIKPLFYWIIFHIHAIHGLTVENSTVVRNNVMSYFSFFVIEEMGEQMDTISINALTLQERI